MQKRVFKSENKMLETYFNQIKSYPLLTFEEELELSRKIQKGDTEALHKLINSNLRLVVKIAGLAKKHEIPILDIIQEGNMGLIHAAEKFDHQKNVRFCTYASWWIKQYINRFISNKYRIVRLPMRKEEILRKIQYTYNVLCQTLMHQPDSSEIATELGIPLNDVNKIINMSSCFVPVEQNAHDDINDAMEVHEDYTYNPERHFMRQFSKDSTMRILNKLKDREKRIISYRYQLNGCERQTLREIGNKFNISPETVRQIEMKALKKIRKYAKELKENIYTEVLQGVV